MLNQTFSHRTRFASAALAPTMHHFSPRGMFRAAHDPSRRRDPWATPVINTLCSVVGALALGNTVNRDDLYNRYDLRLRSYGDRLALFTFATLPSVVALAAVYVSFKCVQAVRSKFSL